MVGGMGMDQMRTVPCERWTGKMKLDVLEEMIEDEIAKGNKPFYVNAMAGSTVMGSFDDQEEVSRICKKNGLWHHIDACWGGFLTFANEHKDKKLFAGAELSDSISFNAHKGFGVPLQTCMLLVNNK